jgi:hypothetical protein
VLIDVGTEQTRRVFEVSKELKDRVYSQAGSLCRGWETVVSLEVLERRMFVCRGTYQPFDKPVMTTSALQSHVIPLTREQDARRRN